jgi:hypothetical protein
MRDPRRDPREGDELAEAQGPHRCCRHRRIVVDNVARGQVYYRSFTSAGVCTNLIRMPLDVWTHLSLHYAEEVTQ